MTANEEPTRRSFTQDELVDETLKWMRAQRLKGLEPDQEKYLARLGLLVDFVTDLCVEIK